MQNSSKLQAAAISDGRQLASSSGNELSLIQQGDAYLVSAVLLHRKLKVKTKFAMWWERRMEKYGFQKGLDYFPNLGKTSAKGGRPNLDYLMTLDMAKEMSMLEENEIGRSFRRYFIQAEKEARGQSQLPKEREVFKGLPRRRMCDRAMLPYADVRERIGSPRHGGGSQKARYWMHFVKEGNTLWVTEEFAQHMYHQRRSMANRSVMLAMQPVLPYTFYPQLAEKGGASC